MTTMTTLAAMVAAVQLAECPKCDRVMRISDDGENATVNVCRLKDDAPDKATLDRRIAEAKARAERYLELGRNVATGDRKCPLMGWSSWNTFGVDISEDIILETARAMSTNGLAAAGYRYVNIDDGFFWGHGEDGILRFHPKRFPNGMKPTVDGIHALGLKAGIYSDAGADTCGSMWGGSGAGGKDKGGVGGGLYGHDAADCKLHFNDLGFDFIKVDYCGGGKLKLDERQRYTEIANAIRATGRADVRLNLCRWAFPGTWAAGIADSWRTTGDIRANWKSVRGIIAENLYLSAYASAGHYNDMDMLEVGQRKGAVKSAFGKHGDTGLTEDEEVTHFGMWCMMSSPLLIGCDVRTLPEFTKRLITNPYLIAMNQNRGLGVQGEVVRRDGEAYVIAKDTDVRFGLSRYVALYNAGDAEHEFELKPSDLELGGTVRAFDLVDRSDCGEVGAGVAVKVSAHGSRFFRLDAEKRLERTNYEAEAAYLPDYQELKDAAKVGTAFPAAAEGASGGVAVRYLGNCAGNDLVWKDVRIAEDGMRKLEFFYASPERRQMTVEVDGAAVATLSAAPCGDFKSSVSVLVRLAQGVHEIRLTNPTGWMPDVDVMRLVKPMMTAWGEKVTSENCWRDYPRPQMVRENWTCLNGDWDYAVTAITNTVGRPKKWDGKIRVPFAIESPLSGVGRLLEPHEFLWYSRKIDAKKEPGRRTLLHFESVDFRAQVFIGHREIDVPHESMNVPFTLDITDYLPDPSTPNSQPTTLTVCVWDPTDSGAFGATGKQFLKPRACFYTRCSGILGSVWMETVPASYVTDYRVTPDPKRGTVRFRAFANNCRETKCRVEVFDSGKAIASGEGTVGEDFKITMPKGYRAWSPDTPNLYDFKLTLGADEVKGYFAMRSFEKMKDAKGILRFALNGKPTFVASTLDQGWWPDGLLTPPSSEALAFEIKTLKDCGFNAVRKHIKVEPRVYYALCDRMGLMVLQDMPCDPPPHDGTQSPDDGFATDTIRYGFYRRDLKRVIDHLCNTPSIVMWIPYNESWGQPGRFLTHATLDWVKAYDPTRLVDGPSGWNDYEGGRYRTTYANWDGWAESMHLPSGVCEAADVVDRHDYWKKPVVFPANDRRISFLGEFGGINLKVPSHLWNDKGHFGYEQRESADELQKAYVDLVGHVGSLVPAGLSGFVYTQTTDVEIETNGLLTYDRKVLKFDPKVLKATHAKVMDSIAADAIK